MNAGRIQPSVDRMAHPFDQAGRLWRARIDRAGEYDLADGSEGFLPAPWSSFVPRSDYDRARRLRDDLVAGYRGRAFEDVFCGREVACPSGTCFVLESRSAMDLDGRDPARAAAAVLGDLKLVRGIGEVTERKLKGRGYRTVADLARHPLYRREAVRLLDTVAQGNPCDLLEWIGRRHRRSDPLLLEASRFHAPEDFVFLDIETLGLFSRPIILIGIAEVDERLIKYHQYLLRNIDEEPAALAAVKSHIGERSAFVTFNGRAFDIPYIQERFFYYGLQGDLGLAHFDVLPYSRRAWGETSPNCRLVTLENFLFGEERVDDVPSALVPEFYETYMLTGNPGPLVPIVEHNRKDLETLGRLFSKLHELWGR